MKHRTEGYSLLSGKGIEIGAFCEPADIPDNCQVLYFDAIDKATARKNFPEIDGDTLVEVDLLGNLDKRDLRDQGADTQEFVIANHVIEHVACPIAMIEDIFHITRSGGIIVVSAPDKRYTYDIERPLTTFEHLEKEYEEGVEFVTDDHYMDFLRHVGKHVFEDPERNIIDDIAFARNRREHAHVWDSDTFLDFLQNCKRTLNIEFETEYLCKGEDNTIECFAVLRKTEPS